MKGLIFLALIALAIWYGWKRYPDLAKPSHEAVIENSTGMTALRVRLKVGDKGFVAEALAPGQKATWAFKVNQDSEFYMAWEFQGVMGEREWRGGKVFAGPMVTRQYFTIDEGGISHRSENKVGVVPGG